MISKLTDTPEIIDGYVRLSRDDNKRNYSSIENQKKIIQQYAEENNMIIFFWFSIDRKNTRLNSSHP